MHAAVTGLSGSGKTQLALKYVQDHRLKYHTILWIDAKNAETARLSYERCCCDLGLSDDVSRARVEDEAHMQVVHRCLRYRSRAQPWLVVLDFADDLSWDVQRILPHGWGGSIIIISQDCRACQLLDRTKESIGVDAMDLDEAILLLKKTIGAEDEDCEEETLPLMAEVVGLVDRLPLGIEIAGARVYNDIRYGSDIADALRQYSSDFARHANQLLQNRDLARTTPNKKTVWAALNFAALRRLEADEPSTSPMSLLILLSYLNISHIQREIFRLASHGLVLLRRELALKLPKWFENILKVGMDGEWDDFFFRTTVEPLHRYALVRPIRDDWDGVTMHSLVARRAQHELEAEETEWLSVILMAAACSQAGEHTERSNFRRHLPVHLPQTTRLLEGTQLYPMDMPSCSSIWTAATSGIAQLFNKKVLSPKQVQPCLWMKIAVIWTEEGRMLESERLVKAAVGSYAASFGSRHHCTIEARNELTYIYQARGQTEKARVLGEETLQLARKGLGNYHKQTLDCVGHLSTTYLRLASWKKAEELGKLHLETAEHVLAADDPSIAVAMSNLAQTYGRLGRHQEAEVLQKKVIGKLTELAGADAPPTLVARGNLSTSLREQGRFDEAESICAEAVHLLIQKLGPNHRDTLVNQGSLAAIYRGQRRLTEARDLALESLQPLIDQVGEDHPSTLKLKENLVSTYRQMGQHIEADEMHEAVTNAKARNRNNQKASESCLDDNRDGTVRGHATKPRDCVYCCNLM